MVLYDRIGITYDATRRADPYLLSRLLYHLRPSRYRLHLDLGCGTGNYTSAIHRAGVRIIGVDLSALMHTRAFEKSPDVALCRANAERLPFRAATFAGAFSTFAHHHMDDPVAAFREVARALTTGAHFVILNSTALQTHGYWLNEDFPLAMKKAIAPFERGEAREVLRDAGFRIVCEEPYEVAGDLQDLFLYSGKHKPEMYLNPMVRAGISAFADASDSNEVERGVAQLGADIKSGRITDVMRSFEHDRGDYMFTVAQK